VALPAFGGITIAPCSPLDMLSPGRNFELPSGHILQYAQTFNHLCQYASYHADNDAKKQDHFRRGLNTKLKERLNLVKANTFSELVNMALT
jgi:hypothetical protein